MSTLTATQLKVLNHLSAQRNSTVLLGTLLQSAMQQLGATATPVNAVNAAKNLAVSGVVIDGETITINNPLVTGSDVYEFLADTAQSKTAPTNIAMDITSYAVKANGTLTVPTQPTSGDTMTIGSKVFTFVPNGTANANGEVSVGTDLATAQAAIVAAINGTDGHNVAHTLVSAGTFAVNVSIITAFVGGTAGNAIATTETFTAVGNVFGAATLGSGTACTAANAVIAIVAAITASDTQGVGAVSGAGNSVDLTADTAGIAGNNIVLAETMANGAFAGAAVALSGGVNGTVGLANQLAVDSSYLYVAIAENTVSGKNWRRISVGSVY